MRLKILPAGRYLPPIVKLFYYPLKWIVYLFWLPIYLIIWMFIPAVRPDYGIYYNTPRDVRQYISEHKGEVVEAYTKEEAAELIKLQPADEKVIEGEIRE